jgi:hypothetical protein
MWLSSVLQVLLLSIYSLHDSFAVSWHLPLILIKGYSMKFSKRSNNQDKGVAVGFINFSLPGNGGENAKLGAIFLMEESDSQRGLAEWLEKDPNNIGKLVRNLTVGYKKNVSNSFNLDFDLDGQEDKED